MKFLRLFALPVLLLCVLPALAQDATPEPALGHAPLQILEVAASIANGNRSLGVTGAITAGCGEPQVDIDDDTDGLVIIDVYTEVEEGVECPDDELEHTVEIPLETAMPETGLTVDINGVPYLINLDGSFGAVFIAPVALRDVTAAVQDDNLVISVVGDIDGCEVPVITRLVVQDGAVNVRLYRVLSAAMTCPMIAVEYTADIEIPLEGDEGGLWVISVNERELGYDFDRGASVAESDLTRIDAVIDSVQVNTRTPLPQQVTITVEGYHPDGCVVPTQVRQQLDAATNALNVRIYRVLPPDVMCPAVIEDFTLTIPLEISISEGTTYTINVNGTTVEAAF